jgi:hypothetical protein
VRSACDSERPTTATHGQSWSLNGYRHKSAGSAFALVRASPTSSKLVVRGRVELPTFRFSGMRTTAGQNVRQVVACLMRALSVLDHDGLGQPCGVAVRGQVGQRRGDLGIAAIYCVEVAVSGGGRGVAKPFHKVLGRGTSRRGQGLASVAKIVEPKTGHVCLAARTGERLADSITAHRLAVAADEHAVSPGPLPHVCFEDGQHVRRDRNGALTGVGLGRGVEGLACFEQFNVAVPPHSRAGR